MSRHLSVRAGSRATGRPRGFSLIELMIVVAVLAILATVVFPAYENLMRSVRRADGRAAAMALAQAQERRFTVLGDFSGRTSTSTPADLFGGTVADSALKCTGTSWATCTSAKGFYSLAVTASTVTATRRDSTADPYCTSMTISLRTGVQSGTGSDPSKCW